VKSRKQSGKSKAAWSKEREEESLEKEFVVKAKAESKDAKAKKKAKRDRAWARKTGYRIFIRNFEKNKNRWVYRWNAYARTPINRLFHAYITSILRLYHAHYTSIPYA